MTIGIYKISWGDEVYIGQSVNVERRIKTHMNNLIKSKHSNNYMQAFYDRLGQPDFIGLICETPEWELNSAEVYFIEEYDSYRAGLNGNAGGGTRTGGSLDRTWRSSYATRYVYTPKDPLGYLKTKQWPEGWMRKHIAAYVAGKPIPPIDLPFDFFSKPMLVLWFSVIAFITLIGLLA